jgi:hypothetical protein
MAGYKKANVSRDTRRPIALPLLEKIVNVLPHDSAFTMAFFALLRVSEVVAL